MTSIELDHFCGLNPIPKGVHFHPNGSNYIHSSGGNVIIGDLIDPHIQYILARHDNSVSTVTLSLKGHLIASGQRGPHADVVVWDFQTHEIVFIFEEHDIMIQALAFSLDEKIIATLGCPDDDKLIFWDLSNGAIISSASRLPAGTTCIEAGGFVKDIKRRNTDHYLFASGGQDGLVFWDLDPFTGSLTNTKLLCTDATRRTITEISFSMDKEHVYCGTTSGDFLVYSAKSLKLSRVVSVATRTGLGAILAGGPDGRIIVGSQDGKLKTYSSETLTLQTDIQLDGEVISLSPSDDYLEVLASTSNGTVYRCNTSTKQLLTISESHAKEVIAIAFSPRTSDRFATASLDGSLRIWDIAEYTVLVTARAQRTQGKDVVPTCLVFDAMLVSGWNDGKILAHSITTGEYLWHIDNVHIDGVTALVISHNGRFLLTGGFHGELRLWDIRTRELISHLKEHLSKVTSLAITEDDSRAISVSKDRCILTWDLRQEKRTYSHMQRMGGINGVVLSLDEEYTITVGQEKRLTFWDFKSAEPIHQQFLDEERDEGRCIARSNNGKYLATAGSASTVRLWDYDSATLLASGKGHSGVIVGIKFSSDDKQVVSVGEDGSIFIWNVFNN